MAVSLPEIEALCRALLSGGEGEPLALTDYLSSIPRLDSLSELPAATRVLVRGDVDAKPGPALGQGDVRLRSMAATLQFGIERGWVQVVFGHIGRKPDGSLAAVARRLGEIVGRDVPLVPDWYDAAAGEITAEASRRIETAPAGSVLLLENTRRWPIETALWKARAADLPELAPRLAGFANQMAKRVARVYVNEALSAGSLDASSTIVPAAMQRVALGRYVADEFDGPMRRCLETGLVVFSGLKIDKLDDLEAMIARGKIRLVITAGSLAMALIKAAGRLEGREVSIGVAEDPAHSDKPYYIPPQRIEQAVAMLRAGRAAGVEFVLPVDFVLADGRASETIGPGQQQFDVGPHSCAQFAEAVGRYIAAANSPGGPPPVAFHNGVFGMFEDPRFEQGTRRFMGELRRMKESGIEVYVGGGEGGTALEKYGSPEWVTHVFTAGGTVLNALGGQPVPYLQALRMAALRSARS